MARREADRRALILARRERAWVVARKAADLLRHGSGPAGFWCSGLWPTTSPFQSTRMWIWLLRVSRWSEFFRAVASAGHRSGVLRGSGGPRPVSSRWRHLASQLAASDGRRYPRSSAPRRVTGVGGRWSQNSECVCRCARRDLGDQAPDRYHGGAARACRRLADQIGVK